MPAEYLAHVFGPGGFLDNHFDRYEPRLGQVQLADAVDRAFEGKKHLVGEGPCGTGKGVAYLVPAIYHTRRTQGRAVVATANIALQEQLIHKDLPLLQKVLPWPFTYALLKGKNNYLCLRKFFRMRSRGVVKADKSFRPVMEWGRKTKTGDRSELEEKPPGYVWAKLSSTSDECLGTRCPQHEDCFATQARKRAREAQIVVTNYHLLVLDTQYGFIPKYQYLVCDEAHELASVARSVLGWSLSKFAVRNVADWIGLNGDSSVASKLHEELGLFFQHLSDFESSKEYDIRLQQPGSLRSKPFREALHSASLSLEVAGSDESHLLAETREEALGLQTLVERWSEQLKLADSLEEENEVYWIERHPPRGWVSLEGRQIDVGPALSWGLWEDEHLDSAALVSATMTAGGSFDLVKREVGLEEAMEIVAASPFDFQTQSRCVIPGRLPAPQSPGFRFAMAKLVRQIVETVGGKTLVLCTSYASMREIADGLKGLPFPVLVQGARPRKQLVTEFREVVESVLVGVDSFWTGVDVPGEALSVVVMDKLPFPVPADPIVHAIRARLGRESFMQHDVPHAVIKFRQGAGRLIRHRDDRGVLVLMDCRLLTKGYGKLFLQSLPSMPLTRNLQEALTCVA